MQADAALRERLISAFESLKEEYPPSVHVEKQIYDGFVEKPDERLMDAFHEAEWPKRCAIVEEFHDPRLRKIGTQLIYLERPGLLDKAICREHHLAAAKRLLGQGCANAFYSCSNPKSVNFNVRQFSVTSRTSLSAAFSGSAA